jgi:hypothetical protein
MRPSGWYYCKVILNTPAPNPIMSVEWWDRYGWRHGKSRKVLWVGRRAA